MKQTYQPGQEVMENWTIVKSIGHGSFGQVFEINRSEFGMNYSAALKIITIPNNEWEIKTALEEGMTFSEAKEYFYAMVEEIVGEYILMFRLKGMSNVVGYEDHAVIPHEDGIGWDILIRMELLTPLLTYAHKNPFNRQDITRLGIDMCKSLELCQKYSIIHRDIKPENIFVSPHGDFKLGDFGIARTIEKTASGLSKKGTYSYMAPEVYRGEEYGFSVDTYSLGIVLYRLLNNNRGPFMPVAPEPITYASKELALGERIRGKAIELPVHSEGKLPRIVCKACAFSPHDRYESPQEMRLALEKALCDPLPTEPIYPFGGENAAEGSWNIATGGEQGTAAIIVQEDITVDLSSTHDLMDGTALLKQDVPPEADENIESTSPEQEETPPHGESMNPPEPHEPKGKEGAPKKNIKFLLIPAAVALGVLIVVGIALSGGEDTQEVATPTPEPTVTVQMVSAEPTPVETEEPAQPEEALVWHDPAMASLLGVALDKEVDDITQDDLDGITALYIGESTISIDDPSLEIAYELDSVLALADLEKLTNLVCLDLRSNQIIDITPLASLTKLSELTVTENGMTDISDVANLTTLTDLNLSTNGISDISSLVALTNLSHLNLSGNEIVDISPLAELKQLTDLDLSANAIVDISSLAELSELTNLYLNDNKIVGIQSLSKLESLSEVDLTNNSITQWSYVAHVDSVLGRTTSGTTGRPTTTSSPTATNIVDATVITFQDATVEVVIRKQLGIYGGDITAEDMKSITSLDLSGNMISNLGDLSHCVNLNTLWLNNNKISSLWQISGLTKLTYLNLSNNSITDISSLSTLKSLRTLYLLNNDITNLTPLASHSSLTTLGLAGNYSLTNITTLASLKNLTEVNLQNTNVSDWSSVGHVATVYGRP